VTGIIYPSVDLSISGVTLPLSQRPLPLDEFNKLAAAVQRVFGSERPVVPGAKFGPLVGRATGSFGDFAWVNSWTPLVRESVWAALQSVGIRIVSITAKLDFGKKSHEPLRELEALPKATLLETHAPEKCPICGRLKSKKLEQIRIAAASFDSTIPLQRIIQLPTVLVANAPLAKYIREKNLRDVVLKPMDVS